MNKERRTTYQHIRVSGSAYKVGRQLGRLLKQNTALIESLTHPFMGQKGLEGAELEHISRYF